MCACIDSMSAVQCTHVGMTNLPFCFFATTDDWMRRDVPFDHTLESCKVRTRTPSFPAYAILQYMRMPYRYRYSSTGTQCIEYCVYLGTIAILRLRPAGRDGDDRCIMSHVTRVNHVNRHRTVPVQTFFLNPLLTKSCFELSLLFGF